MEGTLQQNPQNLGSILESDAGYNFLAKLLSNNSKCLSVSPRPWHNT